MRRAVRRTAFLAGAALASVLLSLTLLLLWPTPLFAFSLGTGRIVVASDRPIPPQGGERLLQDCERLLQRSPLRVQDHQYRIYVANEKWRHRLYFILSPKALGISYFFFGGRAFLSSADFEHGRLVHWGYVAPPPRTLAYFCAHELTHIVTGEHLGFMAYFHLPEWVREGLADYAGIENRQSFEELHAALGDHPVDVPMMQRYGSYPRYRLLVTYFLEKRQWPVERLLQTRLTTEEALALMRTGASD
jgi:hypothetical protein